MRIVCLFLQAEKERDIMKKTVTNIILSLALLFLFSMQASASTVYTNDYFQYRLGDGYVIICGYFGDEAEVTIPAVIAGNPVSEIASGAFPDDCSVKKLNLPDTVMNIEEGAIGSGIGVVYDSNISTGVSEGSGHNSSGTGTEGSISNGSQDGITGSGSQISGSESHLEETTGGIGTVGSGAEPDDKAEANGQNSIEEVEISLEPEEGSGTGSGKNNPDGDLSEKNSDSGDMSVGKNIVGPMFVAAVSVAVIVIAIVIVIVIAIAATRRTGKKNKKEE